MSPTKNSPQKTFFARLSALAGKLRYFLPAALVFAVAALIVHPLSLVPLLVADTLVLVAICQTMGLGLETSFVRSLLRRGVAFFALLVGYGAFVALLVTYPLLILLRDGSLGATLALSTALVVALLSLWRIWPAFGLVFVWDDAYPDERERSWIFAAVVRSFKFAMHLTAQHDLFFSHGVFVGISLLALMSGGLAIAGLGGFLQPEFHVVAVAAYAIFLVPLAQFLVANRCINVLLVDTRSVRGERHAQASADQPEAKPVIPPALSQAQLNAMLLRAARSGETELALAALAHGAEPNSVPEPGERDQRPLLVVAATSPDLRLLRALIAKGADVNRVHSGLTPLLAATRDSYQGRPEAVTTLVTNGADPRIADNENNTALHYAALSSDATIAALLLDANAPIGAVNKEGLTPLGMACAAANWNLAAFLLERGAKLEAEHAQPAIIAAVSIAEDDPSGVKLLIKRKAKVDARGLLGRTALMAAALNGHIEVARALLLAGANANLVDSHGTSALMEAARAGGSELIELIAGHQPVADLTDSSGRSALIIACQSRQANEACVRALLKLGADPRRASNDGKTALDYAVLGGRWNIVALLDPSHAIPASVTQAHAEPGGEGSSSAHLLDALRFGHSEVFDKFSLTASAWGQAELQALYLELTAPQNTSARTWLFNHSLSANAADGSGATLLSRLLLQSPLSPSAIRDLIQRGAHVGGVNTLTQLLAGLGAKSGVDERKEIERLALEMVDAGADFCAPDNRSGRTALHFAVESAMPRLASALIKRGCDPNARDLQGRTALHFALRLPASQALAIVPPLIGAGAEPEAIAVNNETPLGLALGRSEPDLKNWLRWTHWALPGRALQSADLAAAAAIGDQGAIDKLLALGFSINSIDQRGASALIRAAGSGHVELVRHLLRGGADTALASNTGATALSAAVSAQRPAVVEALLESGVAADQPLAGGNTALMVAAALGYPEIASLLLKHGAAVNAQDEKGICPFHAAALFAFSSSDTVRAKALIEALMRHDALLNQRNAAGQTPLLLLLGAAAPPRSAADQKHLLVLLRLFIERSADLNAQDQRGMSALHACALHGLLLPARLLLKGGADPRRRDAFDRAPSEVAQLLGYADVATELGVLSR